MAKILFTNGDKVTVKEKNKDKEGSIVKNYGTYSLVQFAKYKEAFPNEDIKYVEDQGVKILSLDDLMIV